MQDPSKQDPATPSTSQDQDDNISDISNLSGLEDEMQEGRWRPNSRDPMSWIQLKMLSGSDPRDILKDLLPSNMVIPGDVDNMTLWQIIFQILSEPPRRKKLKHLNKLDDAVNLIKNSKKIIILTGAGISVSCGIPDFRSKDGIYAKLAVEYPDLGEPQDMFDIHFFSKNPKPFFKFASEIYPGQFVPSVSHRFIRYIDDAGQLLRNYTQNIDTLEQCAGIEHVIQCHGSFATARCMVCKHQVNSDDIKDDIMQQKIPRCGKCPPEDQERAVMKPDIVFFGEGLPEEFHKQMEMDKDQCDLLIVIGSSLKVRPVALIPNSLPEHVPQILINREPLRHLTFDIELLGNCDVVVQTLAQRLGWSELSGDDVLTEVDYEVVRPKVETELGSGVDNDEATCDSVIETIKECHLCGSREDCAHAVESPVTESGDAIAPVDKTADGTVSVEKGTDDAQKGELVSHDFELNDDDDDQARCPPPERKSLSENLPAGSYAFLPPNRYLFHGGELRDYEPNSNTDDDDSSDDDDDDDDESDGNNASRQNETHESGSENKESVTSKTSVNSETN